MINNTTQNTWMSFVLGEGELSSEYHGRSRVSRFFCRKQEKIQSLSMTDKPEFAQASAGRTRFTYSTPHFFFGT